MGSPALRETYKRAYHGLLASWCRRELEIGAAAEPFISFTFDDFPRSAYRAGGAVLASHGARGTYYAAPGLAGSTDALGPHYDATDLRDLLADGHELASHTFSHISSRTLPSAAYAAEIARGETALHALTGVPPSGHFSYPFGEVTLGAKRAAGRSCASCRGTSPGANGPRVDLNLLRANRLYSTSVDRATVRQLIARLVRPGSWLIFYTHDVRDDPSPYGCTPEYFDAVVRYAVESGARVVTVSAALAALRACQGPAAPSASL
ncbi:MAG TPA: polysaccharide deacetylase family protein [Gemmatimonadaceae bacterium]|nr:polysaccharide deacetylase family protein [Gemmatimonadaceae bacterium]